MSTWQFDYQVCNVALSRVGELQQISSSPSGLSPTDAATVAGQQCALLYGPSLDSLLSENQWSFATLQATLLRWDVGAAYQAWSSATTYAQGTIVQDIYGNFYWSRQAGNTGNEPVPGGQDDQWWEPGQGPQVLPGWGYVFAPPDDLLTPQYVFNGARPGQPAMPSLEYLDLYPVAEVAQLPMINGVIPGAPFDYKSGYIYCDLPAAQLLYTSTGARTPESWPALFGQAVAWKLAVDLALGMRKGPELAQRLEEAADKALGKALAAESNNTAPDWRPDSSFVAVRG